MARETCLLKRQWDLELCPKCCTVKFQLGAKCCEMGCAQGLWPTVRRALQFSKISGWALGFCLGYMETFWCLSRCVFSTMGGEMGALIHTRAQNVQDVGVKCHTGSKTRCEEVPSNSTHSHSLNEKKEKDFIMVPSSRFIIWNTKWRQVGRAHCFPVDDYTPQSSCLERNVSLAPSLGETGVRE